MCIRDRHHCTFFILHILDSQISFYVYNLVKNISAHAHTAAPIRTCGCGVRCGIFGIFNVWVGCGAERLKKRHRTRTLIAGKIWENFLAFFQIFQKKCFHTPPYLTILWKNFSTLSSPHIIIFLPHPHRTHTPPHIRIPLQNMNLEEV